MTAIRLHDYFRSSASFRVRIALNLKGLVYERHDIPLLTGEQRSADNLARNPQGFVPTLEIDGLQLTQSLAIIDYLDARFPEPPILSRDPARRAKTLAQALIIAADTHPLGNLRIQQYLKDELGADPEQRNAWSRRWITEGFIALENAAVDAGRFLGGDAPDLADICLVPQIYNARRVETPLDAFPTLLRIEAECLRHDAFIAAHPDRYAPPA